MRQRRTSFRRFRELSLRDLQCDLHVHTRRTDGEGDVRALLSRAAERKLERVAFTEHVRRGSVWFHDFVDEVRDAARAYPRLEVLVGCETKALDGRGTVDADDAILDACDVVLASVHRLPDSHGGFLDAAALTAEEFARAEYELAMGLLRSERVDVLAHPGGMYARRHGADLPADLMRGLVAASAARGIAVEINASYVQDLDARLRLLEELNPLVSVASDVHRLEQVGRCRDLLVASGRFGRADGSLAAAVP